MKGSSNHKQRGTPQRNKTRCYELKYTVTSLCDPLLQKCLSTPQGDSQAQFTSGSNNLIYSFSQLQQLRFLIIIIIIIVVIYFSRVLDPNILSALRFLLCVLFLVPSFRVSTAPTRRAFISPVASILQPA